MFRKNQHALTTGAVIETGMFILVSLLVWNLKYLSLICSNCDRSPSRQGMEIIKNVTKHFKFILDFFDTFLIRVLN